MRKIKLNLEALSIESFETAAAEMAAAGTVRAHARPPTYNGCCSEIDACPSARGCTFVSPCNTYDPNACPSADDACVSSRGCTDIDC